MLLITLISVFLFFMFIGLFYSINIKTRKCRNLDIVSTQMVDFDSCLFERLDVLTDKINKKEYKLHFNS